jgi:dTDP-glucose pyrophosphorylase
MPSKLLAFQVPLSATLIDALRAIDAGAMEIAFVVDAQDAVIGTLTDGDIRRALLAGSPLDTPVDGVFNTGFVRAESGTPEDEAVRLMLARGVKALPLIDEQGRLADVLTLSGLLKSRRRPNAALIMAGGRGSRLEELTHAIPKPMLPIGNQPLLERIVTHIVSHGIERIFISIHFMGEMIRDHFGDGSRFGCSIEYLQETTPLGSGGCLSLLPDDIYEPLFVMNGDLITRLNVGRMLDFHARHGFAATMGVRSWSVNVPFGVVEIDNNQVAAISEKPQLTRTINAGMYVLGPELVRTVPSDEMFPITNLFEAAIKRGQGVGAYSIENEWVDIGVPEQYFMHHQNS